MKIFFPFLVFFAMAISVTTVSSAHESTDHAHGIKINIIASSKGVPMDIHIEKTKPSIIVTGKIKRKPTSSNMKIRGYADVSIIGNNGDVIERFTARLIATTLKASRNRFSHFKAVLSSPTEESYSVRISHTLKK